MAVKAIKNPKPPRPVKIQLTEQEAIDLLMGGPDSTLSDAQISKLSSEAVNKVRKGKSK